MDENPVLLTENAINIKKQTLSRLSVRRNWRRKSMDSRTNQSNFIMIVVKADLCECSVVRKHGDFSIYPYLRSRDGDKEMYCISPLHGRSFVVGERDGRYIVSKGNGLSYTASSFLNTQESGNDTWGLLLREDAVRDFIMGQEIEALGIKTNHMEYVFELDVELAIPNGHKIRPCILQYDVACPYRICDAAFMAQEQIQCEVEKWEQMNDRGFKNSHMIAAHVLIRNLRILHDHGILHNAIHEQNYTWALELLDFELACSPANPYAKEDYRRHVKSLFPREVIQTYVIINYIAGVLREKIDYADVDALFADYGFNLEKYSINLKQCQLQYQ